MRTRKLATASKVLASLLVTTVVTQAQAATDCSNCAQWNVSQKPFRVYGNTYYVGVRGLSSILITSPQGHILIDGDLAESAPKIAANIQALGFRVKDVKLILNSHVHFDHAGGLAELQKLSGAQVAASPPAARVLKAGHSGPDDPQYGIALSITPIAKVKVIKDGETLHVGPLALTAHFTPGHTPGGTSWTWQSCDRAASEGTPSGGDQDRCLNIAYIDSLRAISAPSFHFSNNPAYPNVRAGFEKSFATVAALPCDILLTPHPEVSDLWDRLAKRDQGDANAFIDPGMCKQLAQSAKADFDKRMADEAPRQAPGTDPAH
jgi:metallo-beta-lactamase class B